MCTLTIRRTDDEVLFTMNRDERFDRGAEKTPQKWIFTNAGRPIWAPQDTDSQGTWAAVNENGDAAFLLNAYDEEQTDERAPRSRGEIIPHLLSQPDPKKALGDIHLENYAAFHLVLYVEDRLYHHSWNGHDPVSSELPQAEWVMMTSSRWNQRSVKDYRFAQYSAWLKDGAAFLGDLPAFHLQQEPGKKEWSVLMQRAQTCTRSITQISVRPEAIQMKYWPQPSGGEQKPSVIESFERRERQMA